MFACGRLCLADGLAAPEAMLQLPELPLLAANGNRRPRLCENEVFPLSQHEIREKKEAGSPKVVVVTLDFYVFTQPRPKTVSRISMKQTFSLLTKRKARKSNIEGPRYFAINA